MKNNNKGFSLVELIVVIAIMGVLMVVLAPQYLKYVEKSRLQKDNSALGEIAENIKIACADEAVANSVDSAMGTTGNLTITATGNQTFDLAAVPATALANELKSVIGDSYTTSSNTYKDSSAAKLQFIITNTNGIYKVTVNNIVESVGGSATSRAF